MVPTLLICGNYGTTNLGDEAILSGILTLIRSHSPSARVVVMSANPTETLLSHQVEAVGFFPAGPRSLFKSLVSGGLWKTLKAVRQCDLFLLGGGGLMADEKLMAVVIWSLQALVARILGKPVFCLGQSVGPLRTRMGRFMAHRLFSRAASITVRDTASKKLLEQLGVPGSAVQVLADFAFALPVEAAPAWRGAAAAKQSSDGSAPYAVLTLRPWHYRDSNSLLTTLARHIEWLFTEHGIRTVLLPFQLTPEHDEAVLSRVASLVHIPGAVELAPWNGRFEDAIRTIAGSRLVMGTRLHSLIFSTLTGTPFLALSYSSKVRDFCADVGMEALVLDIETLTEAALRETTLAVLQQSDVIHRRLCEAAVSQKMRVRYHQQLLEPFLRNL